MTMIGRALSHYHITDKLGEGGMGVVYRAEDTKLKRSVALKFLASHLLGAAEEKERFIREAQAAAALDHPNICTVHEIDEAEGQIFIAMAYLEGETLAKRIEAGPLKLGEALDFAIQTAKGLQEAHAKSIFHRDIKPANLMITPKGTSEQLVKIMDFGLAQLAERSRLTRTDTTLGTIAYMSPEQTLATGTDHRTDIWALGVVLYEMVAGLLPFRGEYDQAVTYSITNEEPEPLTALRTGVPMELEWLVAKCLAKKTEERYQNAGDLIVDLATLGKKIESGKSTILRPSAPVVSRVRSRGSAPLQAESAGAGDGGVPGTTETFSTFEATPDGGPQARPGTAGPVRHEHEAGSRATRERVYMAAAAVLLMSFLAVSFVHFRQTTPPLPVRRFAFSPENFLANVPGRAAISPNGKHIAYLAGSDQGTIWIRDLQREEPRELADTEDAERPFWSPDSQFIGFAAGGELRKIYLDGGASISLCPLPAAGFRGGAWSPDGEVVAFAAGGPASLYQVSAHGGKTERLFGSTARSLTNPHFLPVRGEVRPILFEVGRSEPNRDLAVGDPETGEWTLLGRGAYPVHSASGHILYQTNRYEGGLWALPFSIETLRPSGEAFPVAEGLGEPTVGADGSLVATDSFSRLQQLGWRDRDGKQLELVGQLQERISQPWLSPNQQRVIVMGSEGDTTDVWVHELARPVKTRLTFEQADTVRWTPSGEGIVFSAREEGNFDIFQRSADGTGEAELLVSSDGSDHPSSWTADGKYLVHQRSSLQTGTDIWYLERKAQGDGFDAHPFLETRFSEAAGRVSPDGLFVAYLSNESGQFDVYVRSFPDGAGKLRISPSGGVQARWAKTGTELFYVEGETLMAVSVSTENGFQAGSPRPLFRHAGFGARRATNFDVSADGQRFLVVESLGEEAEDQQAIHVVQNWYEEFRDREQD